jgi:hypothetical protein
MRSSILPAMLRVIVVTVIALPATPIRAADFHSDWASALDRVWIGPEYSANHLQDWRLRAGRVECIESGRNLPARTVHLLTYALGSGESGFDVHVRTGLVEADAEASADAWTGFLLGAGGEHVDHRLTALVHHQPATDGGLLAIIDGTGRVAFRDFTTGKVRHDQWTVRGPLAPEDAPEMQAES